MQSLVIDPENKSIHFQLLNGNYYNIEMESILDFESFKLEMNNIYSEYHFFSLDNEQKTRMLIKKGVIYRLLFNNK